ncbi:MAG: hydrogenase maturation nickel metallochaperone HypA [Planctomycetes bacterium]|nr:hydrogenase maturation nickel metallochaperone HypA [Planctomycetota bacterium]
MHEFGIVQDLINEVKNQAAKHNIKKVSRVEITLGRKSELTPDSLKVCFQALTGEDADISKIPEHKHERVETCHDHSEEISRMVKENDKSAVALKGCKMVIKKSDDHKIIINKITGIKTDDTRGTLGRG